MDKKVKNLFFVFAVFFLVVFVVGCAPIIGDSEEAIGFVQVASGPADPYTGSQISLTVAVTAEDLKGLIENCEDNMQTAWVVYDTPVYCQNYQGKVAWVEWSSLLTLSVENFSIFSAELVAIESTLSGALIFAIPAVVATQLGIKTLQNAELILQEQQLANPLTWPETAPNLKIRDVEATPHTSSDHDLLSDKGQENLERIISGFDSASNGGWDPDKFRCGILFFVEEGVTYASRLVYWAENGVVSSTGIARGVFAWWHASGTPGGIYEGKSTRTFRDPPRDFVDKKGHSYIDEYYCSGFPPPGTPLAVQ